jgi:hypothetical protein
LNELFPITLVQCFLEPVFEQTIVTDEDIGDLSKEQPEIADNHFLVMKVRTASIAFVLAAGGEHAACRAFNRPVYNLSKESKLSSSNHVLDTWYVVEHAAYLLVSKMLVSHVGHGDVEDSPHTAMKENFEMAEKVLVQGPVFASPEEEIHRDCLEE